MLINLAAFVVIVAGMVSAKPLLIPFLLAIFMAIIFSPPVYWMRSKKVPVWLAITLVMVVVIALQVGITTMVGTSLAEFTRALPQYQERMQQLVHEGVVWLQGKGVHITDAAIMEQINPNRVFALVGNLVNSLLAMLKNTMMILLTFVFILFEAAGIPTKLRAMARGSESPVEKYEEVIRGVNRYLGLKTLTSLLTGVCAWFTLVCIGVDYAILWGTTAFVLNFIPTIGSIIAAIPPIFLALVQFGLGEAITTAVIYFIINIGISNLLEPRLMGSRVGLSALVVFLAMAFWGWVLGPMGMLLSVPLTMTLRIGLGSSEKTRHLALLLGSNAEAAASLKSHKSVGPPYFLKKRGEGEENSEE
ncbi:AI-2E family transporter [Desulfogranum japonicum]|uniref:AI-2E family transporter n=1 Tax=Desulfogranum japonicum TaxID=231447 RepID=UPI00040D7BB3|nr:AI-2E family transporter [Desulfogranum japonicum]